MRVYDLDLRTVTLSFPPGLATTYYGRTLAVDNALSARDVRDRTNG